MGAMKQTRLFPKGPPDDPDEAPAAPESREQLRSRRRWDVRAETVSIKRMTKTERHLRQQLHLALLEDLGPIERPVVREDCLTGSNAQRPCPFVSCKHHLYLDVSKRTGNIKMNRPDLEPDEMTESCALDVADRGGETLENVGAIMNITRERVRQIEVKGLTLLLAAKEIGALREHYGQSADTKTARVGGVMLAAKRHLPIVREDDDDDDDDAERKKRAEGEADFDAGEFASEALDAD